MRKSILIQLGAIKNSNTDNREDFVVRTSSNANATSENKLVVFTDGSAIANGRSHATAGYSIVWPNHPQYTKGAPLSDFPKTNNRAEYTACICALQTADEIDPSKDQPLYIYTDSMLLINSVTKWMPGWKRSNWIKPDGQPVLNRDLLEKLDELMKKRRVHWTHVRAHTNKKDWHSKWNDVADKLARDAASRST
jgi:ribonuclease HI